MSIIDELLVLLDDKIGLSFNEIKKIIPQRSAQTISSALGRLNSKGWIKSSKINSDRHFKITDSGRKEITSHLNKIRELEQDDWNGHFLVITFSIPEKKRKLRDTFRNFLQYEGFTRLQNDLWLNFWDKRKNVENTIKSLSIDGMCTIFSINKINDSDLNNFINNLTWNQKVLNDSYKKFISRCEKYLKSKKDGFNARLLVFSYAKSLSLDPKFPKKFMPDNHLGPKAYDLYQKIRPFCYK